MTQQAGYSHGSVQNQIVHLISVDDTWFSGLRRVEIPESLDPANFDDRKSIRAHWDRVEHNHSTDYRAQLLRLLNELGIKTTSQDYIFYVHDNNY